MAVANLYNMEGQIIGEITLKDEIFNAEPRPHVMHEVVRWQLASKRSGTASTKTRGEVRGGGKKPWRQKGTGRARAGSIRSPLWKGGGTVFGPKPRDYSFDLPKRVRRLGLISALSSRFRDDRLRIIDEFLVPEIKTKRIVNFLNKFNTDEALIVLDGENENLVKSARNLKNVKVLMWKGLNVYDILKFKYLFISRAAVERIEEVLGQ